MNQVAVDIVIEITSDMKEPGRTVIRTNAKPEALEEILGAWLANQIGRGKDLSPPIARDAYIVTIGLIFEEDAFCTESDTGNKSLTAGIVMDVARRLAEIPVEPYEADPRYADGRPPSAVPL